MKAFMMLSYPAFPALFCLLSHRQGTEWKGSMRKGKKLPSPFSNNSNSASKASVSRAPKLSSSELRLRFTTLSIVKFFSCVDR
ncbi:hypothetical protein FEM48_Zijuj04G0067000 [Ziziphus jujuba var. spinosa]|uniref:Uncharacterized protein n=1 Tax=Ziziphus jujuba var. spinosa TaxID=714518 RepID=A0A978VID7_ZIZJJ|nr:hypothetical protein FEM48_Zijuj04G0067000 [Ziziphus jujuba var. spinosa]